MQSPPRRLSARLSGNRLFVNTLQGGLVLERSTGPTGWLRPWHDPRASPHEILGIDESASPAAIRRVYLHLVQIWHPDRFRQDTALQREAQFATKRINEAYWALKSGGRLRSRRGRSAQWYSRRPTKDRVGTSGTGAAITSDGWGWRQVLRVGLVVLGLLAWLLMV